MFNNNEQSSTPGWFGKKSMLVKAIIIVVPLLLFGWVTDAIFHWIPGSHSEVSKNVSKQTSNNVAVNEQFKTAKLQVPDVNSLELAQSNTPLVSMMNWIWFGNAAIIAANGGPNTMSGSLMDQRKINLRMITNNSVSIMKQEQMLFINSYANGNEYPTEGVAFVTIMGDGAAAYISEMNKNIKNNKNYGPDYQLQIVGICGVSLGEDCIMGPAIWRDNPQSMKGCIIVGVIGDGDWLLGVRFGGGDKGIKINPDPGTYDAEAINFVPAPEDDFMKAAEQVIAGVSVTLKVKDAKGNIGSEKVTKKIEGCATWFPGDKKVVENTNLVKVVSTTDYPNQMPTVIVGCKKWMQNHVTWTVDFLSATLTAANQIKQDPEWFKFACDLAPRVFCASPEDCSEPSEVWQQFAMPKGGSMRNQADVEVSVGGTQMANYADNKKYFNLSGTGNNYYKSVYDYSSSILRTLNPADFMKNVGEITPYEEVFDPMYLKKVNVESTPVKKIDYTKATDNAPRERNWSIEFASGKSTITSSGEEALEELFNLLNMAENSTVEIIGHTDDQGLPGDNQILSEQRAMAVKQWLIKRSNKTFPPERFKTSGRGEDEPIAHGTSKDARQKNRRVAITLRTLK